MPIALGVSGGETIYRFDTANTSIAAFYFEKQEGRSSPEELQIFTTQKDAAVVEASEMVGSDVNDLPGLSAYRSRDSDRRFDTLFKSVVDRLRRLIGMNDGYKANSSFFPYPGSPIVYADAVCSGLVYGYHFQRSGGKSGSLPRACFEFVSSSGNGDSSVILATDKCRKLVRRLGLGGDEQYLLDRLKKRATPQQIRDVLNFFRGKHRQVEQLVSLGTH